MIHLLGKNYRSNWKKGFLDFSGVRKSTDRLHGYMEDLRNVAETEDLEFLYAKVREKDRISRYDESTEFLESYTGDFCSYHELKDVDNVELVYETEEEMLKFSYRKDSVFRDCYSIKTRGEDLVESLSEELDISFRKTLY